MNCKRERSPGHHRHAHGLDRGEEGGGDDDAHVRENKVVELLHPVMRRECGDDVALDFREVRAQALADAHAGEREDGDAPDLLPGDADRDGKTFQDIDS